MESSDFETEMKKWLHDGNIFDRVFELLLLHSWLKSCCGDDDDDDDDGDVNECSPTVCIDKELVFLPKFSNLSTGMLLLLIYLTYSTVQYSTTNSEPSLIINLTSNFCCCVVVSCC